MKDAKEMTVRLTFIESILGTTSPNEDIFREFIGSKAPDAKTIDEEVAALGADKVAEKTATIFPKENGRPFIYDYLIKGFFKNACSGLKKVSGSKSSAIKAFKKDIDLLIFAFPRKIMFENVGPMTWCQRPLRASTAQGERVSLAMSEEIPAGATVTFKISMLSDSYEDAVREWLDYGVYSGLGQWRNSGHGRFVWEELDENGNVVGGNKEHIAA